MRRSSADPLEPWSLLTASPFRSTELGGAQLAGNLIEHRVDHPGLVPIDEGVGDVHVLGDDDTRRNILLPIELVGPCAQHRAKDRFNALQRPARGEGTIDQRIEAALLRDDAADKLAKERGLRRQILFALDFAAEPMALEFGKNLVETRSREIHLVERLHRRKARSTAAVGFATLLRLRQRAHRRSRKLWKRRFSRTSDSAASTAHPPLSPSSGCARASACACVSTVRMPLPTGMRNFSARSISARADSPATMS